MEKNSCKTYFSVNFEFDRQKNAASLKEGRECTPEELGIFNKKEVEKFMKDVFGVKPEWRRHHFVVGCNEKYKTDVNKMIRKTLEKLLGKEDKIKEMQKRFSVTTVLEIVPYIASDCKESPQNLSLDGDIVDFLYNSGTAHDMDYYVI